MELGARASLWEGRSRTVVVGLLFLAMSLATRGFLLGVDILDVDEAAHIVGSWEWLRGHGLYVDFVDNKPPLLYVYYAIAQQIFGHGMRAVHLLTVLVTVPLIALAVSSFFRHQRTGIVAGLVFLIASSAYLAHDMHAANCELLLLLPATWAIALLRDESRGASPPWLLAAGVLVGAAVLFKQQALAWLPALAVAAAMAARARGRSVPAAVGALVAGVMVPLVATWAVFAAKGESAMLVYWTLVYNFGYAQQPMEVGEVARRFAKYFLPFVAATSVFWLWLPKGWRLLDRYQRSLALGILLASLPIAFIGFRMYPHYFVPLYVPLALLCGPPLATMCKRPWSRSGKLMLAYAAASWAAFSVANGVLYLSGREFRWEEHRQVYQKVADVLRRDPCYDDASMFSWGPGPMFLYAAELPSASRFFGPYTTISGYVPGNWAIRSGRTKAVRIINQEHWDQLMADLTSHRATYVLDASAGFPNWRAFPLANYPRMVRFLAEDYEVLGTVDNVRIFRRGDCVSHRHPPLTLHVGASAGAPATE